MAIVKLFINNAEKNLYESDLTKEGERAVDQIRLVVPKAVAVTVNQEIKYLQDVIDISKEADYMKLKPLIQRWILEASSRRGMV